MALVVATPIGPAERTAIAAGEAWHFSKATPAQILIAKLPGGPGQPNARVRLSPPTGWQLDFWKFVRDAAVWDPNTLGAADRGRYLYCFLGEPGSFAKRMNVQKAPLAIRIRGTDLLAAVAGQNLFYRSADRVVAIRGDYTGPAILDPAP